MTFNLHNARCKVDQCGDAVPLRAYKYQAYGIPLNDSLVLYSISIIDHGIRFTRLL